MANQVMMVPLDQLEENPVALREVDKESLEYIQLRDSIRREGIINPISVTPALLADGKSPKTLPDGRPVYRIVDGLHRYTGAKDAALDVLPVNVMTADDARVEKLQLIANAARVVTKPFEFSQHLNRIMARDQTRTIAELASEICQSPEWVGKRLGLVNLHPDIGKLVDEGKITVTNACDLAKLRPQEEQKKFVTMAMEDSPTIFGPKVKARIKELRDEKRAARDPNAEPGFVAVPHFRKKSEAESELAAPAELPVLIKAAGLSDPVEVAKFVLRWVLHLDEQSLSTAKAKHEQRLKELQAEKAKRAAERAELRAQELKTAAATVK